MDALISVIIPVFNTDEKVLDSCIASVLNQTYANFEIILIDDGSKLKTQAHCLSIAQKHNRVKLFRQTNRGASTARNLGIEESNGTYITFIDSDDEISTVALERLIFLAEKYSADVVCAQYSEKKEHFSSSAVEPVRVVSGKEAVVHLLYGRDLPTGPVGKLFTRTSLEGCRFDPTLTIAEDMHFNYHVFRKSRRIVVDKSVLYWYNNTLINSATRRNFHSSRMDGLRALKMILDHSCENENRRIARAAEYRYCMEALFILVAIGSEAAHPSCWKQGTRAMEETRYSCLLNPDVKLTDKIFMVISALSPAVAVHLYSMKRKLRGLLKGI